MKKRLFAAGSFTCFIFLFSLLPASARPTMEQRRQHADRNDDGVVDRKEKHMEQKWEQRQASNVNTWWERKADTDNNGVVDSNELASWKATEKEHVDLNHDGSIDSNEQRLSWKTLRSRVNTPLEQKYDLNSNGWLEPHEIRQMLKDKYALIQTGGQARVDTEIEAQYDANNDGIIDNNEAKALKSDLAL